MTNRSWPFVFDLGHVSGKPVQRQVIVAYDEIYAIKYFGKKLRPYWRRNGATAAGNAAQSRAPIIRNWRSAAQNLTPS